MNELVQRAREFLSARQQERSPAPAGDDISTTTDVELDVQPDRSEPIPPIQLGWLIVYRGPDGKLRGGPENLQRGTVIRTEYGPNGFSFTIIDGTIVPLHAIWAVAIPDKAGNIIKAWETRAHGFDGEGSREG